MDFTMFNNILSARFEVLREIYKNTLDYTMAPSVGFSNERRIWEREFLIKGYEVTYV